LWRGRQARLCHRCGTMISMATAFSSLQHIVVVMLENRSFDNVAGFLYEQNPQPRYFLPSSTEPRYNGMPLDYSNPSNPEYFSGGGPPNPVPVKRGADNSRVPNYDPQELFDDITFQIFGATMPQPGQAATMNGFLVSYQRVARQNPEQIMQCYAPEQLPVISQLARSFAICDAWYASCPCQTFPNRAFVHAGTSCGQVNNWPYSPFDYDVPTIFNLLSDMKVSWAVYNDSILESATRLQFPRLWDLTFGSHFKDFDDFQEAARQGKLPRYCFVEPSFLINPHDEHPPHDMLLGERFLWQVWNAVASGAHWESTLLLITYDEHGGCCDHQPPPWGATPPDGHRGENGFSFDRYGVRVPAVVVSPWIEEGTVFRSPTQRPYDHTSVLATLRDWLQIPEKLMLTSARIADAPTLEQVLARSTPRSEIPAIPYPAGTPVEQPVTLPPNHFQKGLAVAAAHRLGVRGAAKVVENLVTRRHLADFFSQHNKPR
jgi:phospholipase C